MPTNSSSKPTVGVFRSGPSVGLEVDSAGYGAHNESAHQRGQYPPAVVVDRTFP